jgi:dihydroneopterin aldolase
MEQEKVSIIDAIERIAYEYAQEQGFFVANALAPKLPEIAQRLVEKLPLFGYYIAEIQKPAAPPRKESYGVTDDPNA